jgi:NosR/NirI family transcriptional regulator, nitrous oxide reductase regulator
LKNPLFSGLSGYEKRRKTERALALLAIGLIFAVWFLGGLRAESSLMPAIQQALPDADHFTKSADGLYSGWADPTEQSLVGYVAIGLADGYGGPLTMAVAVDPSGTVLNAVVVDHKETPAWMTKVTNSDLLESVVGKPYTDPYQIGEDLDGVTGATYTSKAIAAAVLDGSQTAALALGLPVEQQPAPKITFGVPEIVLLGLFAVGYIGHQRNFKYKKQARWGSLIVGMVVLGFIYNRPLTMSYIVKMLLGYWPAWQTNLYFYILILGILFVFTYDNKNPYCDWFCPFGGAQECMGLVGGAKPRKPRTYYDPLKWLQRFLALSAILLAVYLRSPGLASYELFGTLFKFVGSSLQFTALGLVLIASLFLLRPWCHYLCPVNPVLEIIRIFREWVKEIWQKIFKKTKTT